jgi:hypothetical protein
MEKEINNNNDENIEDNIKLILSNINRLNIQEKTTL